MEKILKIIIRYISRYSNELTEEKKEIISYGLDLLITKISFLIIIAMISLLMDCFWQCILFTFFFSHIRTISGGFHAKTRMGCFIISIILFIVSLWFIKVVNTFSIFYIPILILSGINSLFITLFAPVDTPNNQLDASEKRIIAKKSRITLLIEIAISVVLFIFGLKSASFIILIAIIETGFLLQLELFKNAVCNRE